MIAHGFTFVNHKMIEFCFVVFCVVWNSVSCVYTVNRFTSCKPFCQVVLLYSQTQCGPCVGVKLFYLTTIAPGMPGLSAVVAHGAMLHFCGMPHRGHSYGISWPADPQEWVLLLHLPHPFSISPAPCFPNILHPNEKEVNSIRNLIFVPLLIRRSRTLRYFGYDVFFNL